MNNEKKYEPDLRFAIAIHADLDEIEVSSVLRKIFPDFTKITEAALRESRNMLVLETSDLYDQNKINEKDGWLYYKYELSVFPMVDSTLEYQRNLACMILKRIKSIGLLAEIICDDDFFETI